MKAKSVKKAVKTSKKTWVKPTLNKFSAALDTIISASDMYY
jgi:hypothetical protein